MTSKKDQKGMNQRDVYSDKEKSLLHVCLNEDSGYSSDSSSASISSSKLKPGNNVSYKCHSHFPTPDINWKMKLRYRSTPHTSSKCELKDSETPELEPIEGPLLRSKTYPSTSFSSPSFELNLSLNVPRTSKDTPKTSTHTVKEKTIERISKTKSCILLRSPIKSPFKLNKKQKSAENVASPENIFSNPEVKQRTVKALFCNKVETPVSTLVRRSSPRLSNILTRLMDSASYLLPNVFNFLSDKDLINVSHVCHQLRLMVHNSIHLESRTKLFLERNKKEFERLGKENVKNKSIASSSGSLFFLSSPRKHLQQLQNSYASPQKISSPKPVSLFEKFVREGKKLLPGETQQKCVECQNPAHISTSESKARCTNESCGFVYCIRCLLPFHEKLSECLALKPKPKVSTASKILSKACKKRLRRL